MTPLEATTEVILSLIGRRDFPELERTIQERAALLASGAEVTLRAWELGDQARRDLKSLKNTLVLESLRAEQIRRIAEIIPESSPSHREYFG